MKVVATLPIVPVLPTKLNQLWFQHQSSREISVIKPMSYNDIENARAVDMPNIKRYIAERRKEEDDYRLAIGIMDDSKSFTYATIVDFNLMENPKQFPGFTYFFKLRPTQLDITLFGVITGDDALDLKPARGINALERSLQHWLDMSNMMKRKNDPIVGPIDPRIEVIIPYNVFPELVILEIEQR